MRGWKRPFHLERQKARERATTDAAALSSAASQLKLSQGRVQSLEKTLAALKSGGPSVSDAVRDDALRCAAEAKELSSTSAAKGTRGVTCPRAQG